MNHSADPMTWLHHELVVMRGVAPSLINGNANIAIDLGIDSLDIVELVMNAESFYDIQIPDEDVEKLKTVNDCVIYLGKKINPMLTFKMK